MPADVAHYPRVEEMAACPVCDSGDFAVAFESLDLLHSVPGRYRYVKCSRCRTVFQNPRVCSDDIGACYPASYFTHESVVAAEVVPQGSSRDRLRRDILRRADGASATPDPDRRVRVAGSLLVRSGSWRQRARFGLLDPLGLPEAGLRCLEVGPGRGHELRNLAHLGWEAVGLEADPVAARLAAQASGCEVFSGDLAAAPWPTGSFDLIYASHVFEHLLDPVEALAAMANLLRSGGRLVLVYPNPRSLCARVFGSLALTWDPPRHIFLAPRAAIRDCLTRAGFECVRVDGLARRAYGYAKAASERQQSASGHRRWVRPRFVHAAEVAGVAVGFDVGEELLVTATRLGSEAT